MELHALKTLYALKMGLVEIHKGERKKRILAAARKLIAKHGFDGLTMRELAEASRVSVPTLYNLFGGKHALLAEEMTEAFGRIGGAIAGAGGELSERVFAVYDAGLDEILGKSAYYREIIRVFLTEVALDDLRKRVEDSYIGAMTANLTEAQGKGELADWIDPECLSRQLFFHYMMTVLGWAKGELDDERARAVAFHGLCLLLLGVTGGETARRLDRRVRDAQRTLQRR
jgi:AcrR family transcriptional regulator